MSGCRSLVRMYKIAVLPGDGVGPEVTSEAIKVLNATGLGLEFIECDVGGKAYIETGNPLPQEAIDACDEADAVLFGAVGHDYAPYGIPRKVLIYLRMEKNAYANVRPLKLYSGVFPEGDERSKREIDVVIVRDNAEGFALEHEGSLWEDKGVDKRVITHFGAHRIAMFAFNYAMRKRRGRVTCVDQSNWLYSDKLFRSAFERVAERQAGIESECMSVDVAAMTQAVDPTYFDVIVTPDFYGDILSGIVIGQIGGVGLAPSACIGDNFAFFEPIHGTAWDIAGKGVANPIASILSSKLMLEWLGRTDEAQAIESSVVSVLTEGKVRTPDMGGSSSTSEVGDAVAACVESGSSPQLESQDVLQQRHS
ncbi:MAG: isocitrate/isopropylmalate dehydrogenase family protein [Candidatus Bathyarchaeia archaeon]